MVMKLGLLTNAYHCIQMRMRVRNLIRMRITTIFSNANVSWLHSNANVGWLHLKMRM